MVSKDRRHESGQDGLPAADEATQIEAQGEQPNNWHGRLIMVLAALFFFVGLFLARNIDLENPNWGQMIAYSAHLLFGLVWFGYGLKKHFRP